MDLHTGNFPCFSILNYPDMNSSVQSFTLLLGCSSPEYIPRGGTSHPGCINISWLFTRSHVLYGPPISSIHNYNAKFDDFSAATLFVNFIVTVK